MVCVRKLLKEPIVIAWLIIFLFFTILFLIATEMEPRSIVTNVASFSATMMGVGAAGFVAFYLIEWDSRRRRNLSDLWYYRFIRQTAGLLAIGINFYIHQGYEILNFEDQYPFMKHNVALVAARTMENSLNVEIVDISNLLKEMRHSLYDMNQRMIYRRDMNLWPNDLGLMSRPSRSTLNTLFPIIEEFRINVLNPGARCRRPRNNECIIQVSGEP